MFAMTPSGSCEMRSSSFASTSASTVSLRSVRGASARKKSRRPRSPLSSLRDCRIGLPTSEVSVRASVSCIATTRSLNAAIAARRFLIERAAHAGCAARARWYFRRTSALASAGTSAMSSPLAGLWIFIGRAGKRTGSRGRLMRADRREDLLEQLGLDRLREVMVEASVPRALAIGILAPARDGNERGPAHLRALPQRPGDLVTAHAGKADVHQHDLRTERCRELDRGAAFVGELHLMTHEAKQHGKALGGIRVIVDDEDPQWWCDGGARPLGTRCPVRQRPVERQSHRELAPLAGASARHLDGSPVHLHEAANQREPDAESTLRAVERRIDLREHVEDSRQHLAPDADAAVADADADLRAVDGAALHGCGQRDA